MAKCTDCCGSVVFSFLTAEYGKDGLFRISWDSLSLLSSIFLRYTLHILHILIYMLIIFRCVRWV